MFCAYIKIVKSSTKKFDKSGVYTIKQLNKNKERILWLRIKDIGKELDVKNIFDLVDKEIKGKFETNHLTKQRIR